MSQFDQGFQVKVVTEDDCIITSRCLRWPLDCLVHLQRAQMKEMVTTICMQLVLKKHGYLISSRNYEISIEDCDLDGEISLSRLFDINLSQNYCSPKSRDSSVVAKSLNLQSTYWFISSYK